MTLQFWQGWPRNNRIFLFALFVVFAAAMANMWTAYFVQPAPAITLQTITEPDIQEIAVDQFSKGPFEFTVKGNNYVVLQRELGSELATSDAVAYTYLVFLAVFVIGMLAVISTLGRFYYLVGMGLFILFITTLSPELLGVFGNYGKTFTVVIMALYGLTSFWLFYFATTTSFFTRVLLFTAVTALLWAAINFFSVTEKPFIFIATYGAESGLLACGLFIVTVAHEIVAGFIFAVTQSTKTQKSLNHFLIITVVYIINLALAYSVRFGFIHWNIIVVDLFLLLTISGILGIWGIRQRHKTYEGVIDSDPYAVFAFLLTGAFAFATIAMFMYNANDTALSAISDIIIFTHIGFGFIFLTYVFSNFGGMLAQNMQVYKVLYLPTNMPYFTFRFAGLITTLALLFYNAWQVPVHNAMSGFYNGIGDLYVKLENTQIARVYYDESRTYGFRGHHANYAMANIEGEEFNNTDERIRYADASTYRPTPMSFLNLAQTYQSAGDNMQAILTLTEGLKKLKNKDDRKAIENTLGILYAKAGMPDSASKYLARSSSSSNLLGIAALYRLPLTDSVQRNGNDDISKTNWLALANTRGHALNEPFALPVDTVLTLAQAAGISNYLVNTKNTDTAFVRKVVTLARKSSNSGFKEALLFASSISLYNSGETMEAFTTLEEVTVGSDRQGKYNNILTMWALENNEPERAFGYADYAVSQQYAPAKPTSAVALTELGRLKEALVAWDTVATYGDTSTIKLSNRLIHALQTPASMQMALNDDELYAYARYRLTLADSNAIFLLINRFTNDNLKARTLLDFAERCYSLDKPAATLSALNRIVGLQLTDPSIEKRMRILEMLARIQMGQASMVAGALQQNPLAFNGKDKKYQVYFDALAAEVAGDTTTASAKYRWLAKANPYFDDGLIAAARFFRTKKDISYNALADGLLHHPSSIKIRKAYALESARVGFENYAKSAIESLKSKIAPKDLAELSKQVDQLLSIAHQ